MKKNFSIVRKVLRQHPGMAMNMALSYLAMKKASEIDRRYRVTTTKELGLIYFRITPLCNLRCVMCGQRGEKGVLKGRYAIEEAKKIVPVEKYFELVDEIAPKRPVYYMWGGEPFMYPDFMDLCNHITKKGSLLSVNTNGTYLARNADQIVRDQWHALFVSLDGFEDVNDKIRGKGSYKRVVDGFKAINEAKRRHKSSLPYMGIVTTVSKLNYLYLHDLAQAAAEFDLSWHYINLGTYTNDDILEKHKVFMREELDAESTCLQAYNTGYNEGIDGEKFKEILKKVHAADNGYPIVTVPVIDPDKIGEYYSNLDVVVRDNCVVPWCQANIDYNGDVHFCADYPDYVIGNIQEEKFFDIFNNERAQHFRRTLRNSPDGLFPGCVRCYQNMLFGYRRKGY